MGAASETEKRGVALCVLAAHPLAAFRDCRGDRGARILTRCLDVTRELGTRHLLAGRLQVDQSGATK